MRISTEFTKGSKLAAACLAGALTLRCVDFAPDLASENGGQSGHMNDGGRSGSSAETTAGESGESSRAGASAEGGEGGAFDAGAPGVEAGAGGTTSGSAGNASSGSGGALLGALAPQRSVIETNPDVLTSFTLQRVLQLATGEDSLTVFRAFVQSFDVRGDDQSFTSPRCDDESPSVDGYSTLNGFAVPCPAEAASLYWQLPSWKPLAITNRFDLAPAGGENCGEQHLSFFYDTSAAGQPAFPLQAYLRFEAVIANPAPDLGLEGCRPLIDFWASLGRAEYDTPVPRGRALELAFFGTSLSANDAQLAPSDASSPSPELTRLMNSGMEPLLSAAHFGHVGRLQLLYLGDFGIWHFFEHQLLSASEGYVARHPLTQTLPVAALLDDHPKRDACVNALLASIPGLLSEDVNLLRMTIDPTCFDATNESTATTLVDGLTSAPLGPDLVNQLDDRMQSYYPELGLHGRDVAVRAQFGGTCTGCHYMTDSPWSNPSSVSQVSRDRMQACASAGPDASRRCYARSPLLDTVFVPHWTQVLDDFYQHPGSYGPLPNGAKSSTAIDGALL